MKKRLAFSRLLHLIAINYDYLLNSVYQEMQSKQNQSRFHCLRFRSIGLVIEIAQIRFLLFMFDY